jgi:FKBP-type peptidyl-prolyl cis-trans isomerase FklB
MRETANFGGIRWGCEAVQLRLSILSPLAISRATNHNHNSHQQNIGTLQHAGCRSCRGAQEFIMKKVVVTSCLLLLSIAAHGAVAQENLPVAQPTAKPSNAKQYSYAIGLDIGKNFEQMDVQLDAESLLAGLQAGLGGNKVKPLYDQKTLMAAMQQLQALMQEKSKMRQQAQVMENKKLGEEFLAKNKEQPGVKVTKTGLQYKVITSGDGATPKPTDTVSCNYRGTLIDGTEFDASANRGGPAQFAVNRVIDGWTEALQLMKVGDKWQLFIPAELAYRDSPPGPPIQPGSTLIFDIELLGIEGQ